MMSKKITIPDIQRMKVEKKKISMVTCYDSSFARLVDQSPIDMVLVGDSLGNVMMGYRDTIPVTLDHMIMYAGSVGRILQRAFLCVDLPFMSYATVEQALHSAARIMQETGAQCVKLEGGEAVLPQIEAIVKAGIPVVGHLGLTPQSVHQLGGMKVQGRSDKDHEKLLRDAKKIEGAGAFALVLEMIPSALATKVTSSLDIPVIGIGAGAGCDGQVLVLQDLLGFDSEFSPKFLKKFADFSQLTLKALKDYDAEVKAENFPTKDHSFS